VDFLACTLAEDFGRSYGFPFVVENRPGANGNIGVDLVVKAPADGHTMFVSPPGPFSINVHLMPSMPFDPARDLAPVTMLAVAPLLLVVHPSIPAGNLSELLAWLRAQGGRATYASQAVASTGHLAMELLKSRTGVEAVHVPYKGSAAQATADLLSGRVSMSFVNTSTTLPHIASGRLRAIGVAELKRIRAAPDIPTLDESGLPGFEATTWLGLGMRAGTPADIVSRLAERSARALAEARAAKHMAGLGIEPRPMTPEEFAAFLLADSAKWADIIRRSGVKLE
jgi:tripartite-type tricarboxylate transporter receptor subunit TctC